MELVQSCDCYIVSNYIVLKKNTLTIFPVCFFLKEKTVFSFILCFSFLEEINCTFYLGNSCIFHRENIVA